MKLSQNDMKYKDLINKIFEKNICENKFNFSENKKFKSHFNQTILAIMHDRTSVRSSKDEVVVYQLEDVCRVFCEIAGRLHEICLTKDFKTYNSLDIYINKVVRSELFKRKEYERNRKIEEEILLNSKTDYTKSNTVYVSKSIKKNEKDLLKELF